MEVDTRWLCRCCVSATLEVGRPSIRLVFPHLAVAVIDRSLFVVSCLASFFNVHPLHIEMIALCHGSLARSLVTFIISCCAFLMVFCILLTHTCLYYQARFCVYPLEQYVSLLVGQRGFPFTCVAPCKPPPPHIGCVSGAIDPPLA